MKVIFGNKSINPDPSIIIALADSVKWVKGKIRDIFLMIFGVPSNEKNTPEKIIMGHITIFKIPPPNSSLRIRLEIARPNEIIQTVVKTTIINRSKYEPFIR